MKHIRASYFSIILFFFGTSYLLPGCKKYLDAKPDQKLSVPTTVIDLQALLDRYQTINTSDPGTSEVSADNYYVTDADWNSRNEYDRNMYIWQKANVFQPYPSNDWNNIFTTVYYANTCIDGIKNINRTFQNASSWDNVKGTALMTRAKAFLQAAFIWSPAFDSSTSINDLGLPLRLSPDFNMPSVRSSVMETYNQIIDDFKNALLLLPDQPLHVMRPSKAAVLGLLARTYLAMRQYDSCYKYADQYLQQKNVLMNFSSLNQNATYPMTRFNSEVIYEGMIPTPALLTPSRCKIDSSLYRSYDPNDLRKSLFFKPNTGSRAGTYWFKGSYEGSITLFDGIATDEVLLMRSECAARKGNMDIASADVNKLLQNRWKNGTYTAINSNSPNLLTMILQERRKELLMRGLRWMDIKRLNKENGNIILSRVIAGQSYKLSPNSTSYALAIPEDVIQTSGMKQNP